MADFVAVLRKTLEGLGAPDPAMRARVYDKARATVAGKLSALNPPPPPGVAERQRRSLEEAIASIEREYAGAGGAAEDPLAELESVFASLKNPQPKPMAPPAPTAAAPPSARVIEPEPTAGPLPPPEAPRFAQEPEPLEEQFPEEPRPAYEPRFAERPQPDDDLATVVDQFPGNDGRDRPAAVEARRRRGFGRYLAAAIVLAMLAGGAFGVWLNRDAFDHLLGLSGPARVAAVPPAAEADPEPDPEPLAPVEAAAEPEAPVQPAALTKPAAQAPAPAGPAVPADAGKFTQRLTPAGTETDPGPAGGETSVGEGTSVAALNQPPQAAEAELPPDAGTLPAAEADQAADMGDEEAAAGEPVVAEPAAGEPVVAEPEIADGQPAIADGEQEVAAALPEGEVPSPEAAAPAAPAVAAAEPAESVVKVGQKAIFYEERTSAVEGSAEPGSIVWSLVEESPGGNLPAEPAIRAEATIPGKDLQLRMTIKRNADQTLPASHIIEMIFLTPEGFEGGGIENILRVAMKSSEQEAGNPLIGIPAKIADGFFLVALNDTKAEIDANLTLLRRQSWIDVPVVYKSGRRALLTMEKGVPGDKVFDEALKAWQAATAG